MLKLTRQLGCVSQDMETPKYSSILPKSSDTRKPIRCVRFTKAVVRHADTRDQNPSLGTICPGDPHQRSPNAPKFEDRSQEQTEWQERCAREAAWRLAKSVLKFKEEQRQQRMKWMWESENDADSISPWANVVCPHWKCAGWCAAVFAREKCACWARPVRCSVYTSPSRSVSCVWLDAKRNFKKKQVGGQILGFLSMSTSDWSFSRLRRGRWGSAVRVLLRSTRPKSCLATQDTLEVEDRADFPSVVSPFLEQMAFPNLVAIAFALRWVRSLLRGTQACWQGWGLSIFVNTS